MADRLTADERAKAEREQWLSHAQSWANTHLPDDQPAAQLLGRRYVALDAQLTAVEQERDEAWWHAAHNDEKAVAAEKERDQWRDLAVPAEASPQWAALEERTSRAEKDNQRLEAMLDQLRTFNQSPTAALLAEENQRLREVLIRLGQFARREIDAALSQDTSC